MGQAKQMALCGVMAALAVVIMSMGTLIPLATFVCPVLSMVILGLLSGMISKKMAWAWFVCVAILSALLAPDKEAAAVFVFLGHYPILKPVLEKWRFSWLWKLMLFNTAILLMYGLLIYVFDMADIAAEFAEMGRLVAAMTLALGNVCMLCVDRLLTKLGRMK